MKLLEPFKLGPIILKNRIVMSPMVTNYGTKEGYVSEQMKAYYEARAKGGAGLIIVEATSIDLSRSKNSIRQISIDDDKFIPSFRKLVETIHAHGTKIALQLHHGGNVSRKELTPLPPVSASAISYQDAYQQYVEHGKPAEELTVNQIADLVKLFTKAAGRAQRAGFDAVEIHGATGYLIGQFLSAAKNKRTDDYGGKLSNRARFLLEIIAAIREEVGDNYPISCKLSAEEIGLVGGITFEETRELVHILQDSSLDAIYISGLPQVRTCYSPSGYFVDFAKEIKKVSKLPTGVTGAIDPELGERILQENQADLIAIGRAFLVDPEWPNKLAKGRTDDIKPCLRDASCRDCIAYEDTPVTCTVNAAVGKERELAIRPAEKAKRVVVVGGGPAGMEASKVARERGHDVILFEKEQELGGQLLLATVPPNKELIEDYRKYLINQNRKLGVKLEVGRKVTIPLIREIQPDAVIIATGSSLTTLKVPGKDRDNVFTVEDILKGNVEIGNSVIIIGGGTTGCETAHYLVKSGKNVTIVEMLEAIAVNRTPSTIGAVLLDILTKSGVTIMNNTKVEEIAKDGLVVSDQQGHKQTLNADTIILATGRRSNNKISQEFEGLFPDVYVIGDAVQPGLIREAVETAVRTALSI